MKQIRYVLGFLTAVGAGLLLQWLYGMYPSPAAALVAPISGSAWEQGKLVFWPYLAEALVIWSLSDRRDSRGGHCLTQVAMSLLVMLTCWAVGAESPVYDLLWLMGLGLGTALYGLVLRRKVVGGDLLWYTLAILLGIAYVLFTALPPMGGPFADPLDVSAMATIPY